MRFWPSFCSRSPRRTRSKSADDAPTAPQDDASTAPPKRPTLVGRLLSPRSSRASRASSVALETDEEVRAAVTSLVAREKQLITTLLALDKERDTDQDAFLGSEAFQEALQEIQSCQRLQKELLAMAARVQALSPTEYKELMQLSVELMTTFSRTASEKDAEDAPQSITDNGELRQRSLSASI